MSMQNAEPKQQKTTSSDNLLTDDAKASARLLHDQKLKVLGQLTAGVVHDVNNLIGVILGYSELVHGQTNDDPKLNKKTKLIFESAQKASELSKQLLDFSRFQTNAEKAELDLGQSIHDIKNILSAALTQNIDFKVNIPSDLWPVLADKSQVLQMLMNLVINAKDAMPQGGDLSLSAKNINADKTFCLINGSLQPGHYVRLTVSDTGMGIPKDMQSKVFEPFFTTKSPGQGTGLGLASVSRLIQDHGGTITYYSEENLGSLFHLYFPAELTDKEIAAESFDKTPTPPLDEVPDWSEMNILVVDDEEIIRDYMKTVLSETKAQMLLAPNGLEGLKVFDKHRDKIDLVILDIVMPEMNGIEAFKKIREINQDVPILMASGYTKDAPVGELVENNRSSFIQKPFQKNNFFNKLKTILDK